MITIANKKPDVLVSNYRYEVKVPLDRAQYEGFIPSLLQMGLYPTFPFPDRRVNSVYYDTAEFSDYSENITGISDRCKTRVRWYNGELSKLTLEHKIKKNKMSKKESISIQNPALRHPQSKVDISKLISDGNSRAKDLSFEQLFPTLEVQYERQYFLLNSDLRMTIDRDQLFRKLWAIPSETYIRSSVYAVVEFKYPSSKKAEVRSLLNGLPYRLFRHSKYVCGIDTSVF